MTQHYFSPDPESTAEYRDIEVVLAGRQVTVQTGGGVFSTSAVDRGTQILLKRLEASSSPSAAPTTVLDLGCGWGPITLSLALTWPDAVVWAVDQNPRALALTARNAESLGLSNVRTALPDEVPADVAFDEIWSNPPIRVGKAALHTLLERWLARLLPGGEALLVVAKQLGADSLAAWLNERWDARRVETSKGYRILSVLRR